MVSKDTMQASTAVYYMACDKLNVDFDYNVLHNSNSMNLGVCANSKHQKVGSNGYLAQYTITVTVTCINISPLLTEDLDLGSVSQFGN